MRATRRGRPDSAARLRALTRRAYTATAGHLDLDEGPEPDDAAGREFDRIVGGEQPGPRESRAGHRAPPGRRWAVSGRAVVAVLAVVAALAGAVVARAIAHGPSDAVPVPRLEASADGGHGQGDAPDADGRGDGTTSRPAASAARAAGDGAPPGAEAAHATGPVTDPADGPPPHAGPPGAEQPHTGAVVHVAGAVERPGVVELPAGSRVAAAVAAAGGALEDAELSAVNLARPVVDGEQVYVPRVGEVAPGAAAGAGGPGGVEATGGPSTSGGGPADAGLVDLNTADLAALDTLPGVGPAIAQRILQWRETNGPFHSVDELLEVSGIGPATLERLRDRVRV